MIAINVIVEQTSNNLSAYLQELPGCIATGDTPEQLEQNMRDAVETHIEALRDLDMKIPDPFNDDYELIFLPPLKFADISTKEGISELYEYLREEYKQGKTEFRLKFSEGTNFIIHPLGKDGRTLDGCLTKGDVI